MKKFKKVVPALCALLVSAVMLGSSTYAWFSMNTQVTATGMNVTATSNSTYLVISDSTTLADKASLDLSSVKGTLLPVSYTTTDITESDATVVHANKWFTATGTNASDGSAKNGTKTELNLSENGTLTADETKQYYVVTSFYIGLAQGSSAVETGKGIQADVKFNAANDSNLHKCLTVKIVYGDNTLGADTTTQTYVYGAANGPVTKYSTDLQADTLITTKATKVTVYIYFDGADANCTTANAINLGKIQVDLTFTVNADLHN